MAKIDCRDIFNAIYVYVRGSYISSLFSSKVKSKTESENVDLNENLKMTKTLEPQGETNVNTKKTIGASTETVTETVDRMEEMEVADKIRMDIDEKFPFAMASVCSNLATIDREYRKFVGESAQPKFSEYMIPISEDFPLCERFVFPAIMYVSSMVLMDIDEKKSDDFYDKYACAISQIISELPSEHVGTIEKYPY